MKLPILTRGESIPIVHCVRHRRCQESQDQYGGQQLSMEQEYINVTRPQFILRMYVEEQPFGTPGHTQSSTHTYPNGASAEKHGSRYAFKRNAFILEHNSPWGILRNDRNFLEAYISCFGRSDTMTLNRVNEGKQIASKVHDDLRNNRITDLPDIGQSPHDYHTLSAAFAETAKRDSKMAMFTSAPARDLREVGHSKTLERFNVSEHHKRAMDPVDVCSWDSGLRFGNVLLPGATAEISPTPDRGTTRLCIPFLWPSNSIDPEEAITSICAMTWYFACLHDEDLVHSTRLQ